MNRGPEWPRIRKFVKDRDKWRCRKCGKSGRLEVHHLDGNRDNDDFTNLVTWCVNCHVEHHRRIPTLTERKWERHLATFN